MSGTIDGTGEAEDRGQAELGFLLFRQHHSEHEMMRKKAISPPKEAMYQTTDQESRDGSSSGCGSGIITKKNKNTHNSNESKNSLASFFTGVKWFCMDLCNVFHVLHHLMSG